MAESGEDVHSQVNNNKNLPETQSNLFTDDEAGNRDATGQKQSRPSSANKDLQKEREERIKQMKERQNEERQRKLEELKAQALAAQKFREQKEEERRRRMEDLRRRENDRRSQVEERRRAIQEADNERRQYIMQKNQARDIRMDAKRRNERSSIQFAFGSSTPRMIDTTDSGMCSSFWANRRATSITNVAYTGAPLTRRSSERELTDGNSKKRATSASGLDRSTDDDSADMSYQRTVNRRKTDLMPTIPSPRDSSRSSLGTHTPRTPGLRSGEITPNSLNTSRPGSAMSSSTTASGVVYRRSLPQSAGHQRKPRPASIAVTGVSAGPKEEKPPLPKISAANNTSSTSLERKRSQSGASTPARPPTAPSADSAAKKHHTPSEKSRLGSGTGSARGTPKASSTPLQSPGPEKANRTMQDSLQKQPKKQPVADEQHPQQPQQMSLAKEASSISAKSSTEAKVETVEQKQQQQQDEVVVQSGDVTTVVETVEQEQPQVVVVSETKHVEEVHAEEKKIEQLPKVMEVSSHEEKKDEMKESTTAGNKLEPNQALDGSSVDLMTASMIAKRINTEEEAKAALAERRRLAREEAERQAELERQRIAAEEEAERQRQLEEEERLRKLEEETIRLVEEQRRLEEERLQQAIQEVEKREEEDRQRRDEEARQKVEREEAEKKAREEAERQRIEMAERLKKEEKEREERRKRVEAIMSRTRAKGSANNTPTKQSEDNGMSKSVIVTSNTAAAMVESTMSMTDSMLGSIEQQQQQPAFEPTAEVEEKTESLEQAVQSLSLVEGDQQNQENNNSNDSSLTSNHNNNNNNINSSSGSTAAVSNNAEYERSVTEKENLLLGSFNNNLNSNATSNGGSDNGSSQQPSSLESSSLPTTVAATTNGKSTPGATTIAETTELIIEDAIMSGQTNGHKNGSIDNVLLVALVNE